MNNLEQGPLGNQEEEKKLEEAFDRLLKIAEVLREMGFDVTDRLIKKEYLARPTAEWGIPIVSDGLDGIRASYSLSRGLRIGFHNCFEDPSDERRLEVVKRLTEEGLM